ncbi:MULTISPECIES: type I toxin-antitoxin system Fst family toxin [Mammaliicoccus]|nr:type I toxin-antitoxin system Fst family toxin [Mammaliicoccus lentus]
MSFISSCVITYFAYWLSKRNQNR